MRTGGPHGAIPLSPPRVGDRYLTAMTKSRNRSSLCTSFLSLPTVVTCVSYFRRKKSKATCLEWTDHSLGRMWNNAGACGDGCTAVSERRFLNWIGRHLRNPRECGAMETTRYEQLYRLQDAAMAMVFSRRLGFYLTGGTALSRFHLDHRYSDDLGFLPMRSMRLEIWYV